MKCSHMVYVNHYRYLRIHGVRFYTIVALLFHIIRLTRRIIKTTKSLFHCNQNNAVTVTLFMTEMPQRLTVHIFKTSEPVRFLPH